VQFSRFVGLDVHAETTSICMCDRNGRVLHETVIPTTAAALRRYFRVHRGRIAATLEEGSLASWVYQVLHGRVADLLVCNPRHNRLLNAGSKSDRIDAKKLAELLRIGTLRRVHHDAQPLEIRELVTHYDVLVTDVVRVMLRIRALYRSNGVRLTGDQPHARRTRRKFMRLVRNEIAGRRLERLYRQLDTLTTLRDEARLDMLAAAARYPAFPLLQTIPHVGDIRAAQLLAWVAVRHFPTRSHLWSYAGFAVVTRSSSDHDRDGKRTDRKRKSRGLNLNCNPRLKRVLKDIALGISIGRGPMRGVFDAYIARGLSVKVARVALGRRVAAIVRAVLRDQHPFDEKRLPGAGSEQERDPLPTEARA
jgi:hypothetical protein